MAPPPPPNPTLRHLGVLTGEWAVEAPQFPGAPGRAVIEWLEGGAYLRMHVRAPDPAPTATWIVGRDDASGDCTALYHDSRGVSRVYGMSLEDGVWRLWRDEPGFRQRFSGTLDADGTTIRGAWEKSPDGTGWEHDFDLVYTRVA